MDLFSHERRRAAYMNRVMIDVFPTAWSPTKTSLYLRRVDFLVCPFCGGPSAIVPAHAVVA
eukprot:5327187-Pleurochrysis_carterae.AAC.2